MSIVLRALVGMPWATFDVIKRSVMLATIFFQRRKAWLQGRAIKAWLQGRAIKSDQHYLATQTASFIVPYVHSVINSVLDHQLNSGLDYPTIRVTSNRKRGCAVW